MAKNGKGKKSGNSSQEKLNRNLEKISAHYERVEFQNYLDLIGRPKKLLWVNFLAGLARGVGMLMGAGMLGTIIVAILVGLIAWAIHTLGGLPWIGQEFQKLILFIRDLVTQHR